MPSNPPETARSVPVKRRARAPPPASLAPSHWADTTSVVDKYWGEMTSEAIHERCLAVAPRNPLHTHRLLRRLYLVFFIVVTLFILVPLWALWYIPRFNRPRKSWTLKRTLRVRWSRRLCAVVARCEIDYLGRDLSQQLDPKQLQHSHPLMITPAPESWLLGYAASSLAQLNSTRGQWKPAMVNRRSSAWSRWRTSSSECGFVPVPAFWYAGPKETPDSLPPPRRPGEPVLIFLHGGGYVAGTAAETDGTARISKSLVEHTTITHVLSVDYRLAPRAPWPLPLLDAISAYYHAVAIEGIDERDILLGGDSAGGHLALALTRWLRDNGVALGLRGPRALLLFSPWCDTGFTHLWGDKSLQYNAHCDTIDDTFGPFASGLLARALPPDAVHQDIYLSPASRLIAPNAMAFLNFPPVFVVYGSAERLGREIAELYSRIELGRKLAPAPADDVLLLVPDSVHDFMIFPWFEAEAAGVYERLDEWLRDLLGTDDSDEDFTGAVAPLELTSPAIEVPLPNTHPAKLSPIATAMPPYMSPSSPLGMSPLSSMGFSPHSPFLNSTPEARRQRRESRAAIRTAKSPRLVPHRDTPRLMYADMRSDGMHLLDLPSLDAELELPPPVVEMEKPANPHRDTTQVNGHANGANGNAPAQPPGGIARQQSLRWQRAARPEPRRQKTMPSKPTPH